MDNLPDVSGELWEEARKIFLREIGESKEQHLERTSLKDTILSLTHASEKASREYGEHSIRKDKKPKITVKLGNIMKRLEVFMQIGDAYMGAAPETVSLVWMSFRMIFTGFLKDAATCEFLTDAVDQISDIMFMCNVFEQRYMKANDAVNAAKAIKDAILAKIPPLYASVLKFSHQSRMLFKHGKLSRSFMSWRSVELEKTLSEAQSKLSALQDTVGIGFQDAALDALQGIEFDLSIIRGAFDTIRKEIAPGVKNIQAEQARAKNVELQREIERKYTAQLQWLKSGRIADSALPGRTHRDIQEKVYRHSVDWVLNSPTFKAWRDAPEGAICWLRGEGGFGKSFLISSMLEHLESENQTDIKHHCLYFFCSKGDDVTSNGKKIFLHLLIQLYEKAVVRTDGPMNDQRERLSQIVEDVFDQSKFEEQNDSSLLQLKAALLPMFEKLVAEVEGDIFLMIDGMDECTDYNDFVDAALRLSRESKVHLMISSRPEVLRRFKKLIPYEIEVTAAQTQVEISKYVRSKIRRMTRFLPAQQKKAIDRIAAESSGSFRYADVILKFLSSPQAMLTKTDQLLDNLPSGMNALYRQSMASLDPNVRQMLIVALRWLICGFSQIPVELIADEFDGRWDFLEKPEEERNARGVVELYEDEYSDSGSDSKSSESAEDNHTLQCRGSALVIEHERRHGEIAEVLQIAGRDFLKIENGFIDVQHNSVRDFILAEEETFKNEVEKCDECSKRFKETIAYEAGPKEGQHIICQTIVQRLNHPAFQREYIIEPSGLAFSSSASGSAVDGQQSNEEQQETDVGSEVGKTSVKHIPDMPDDQIAHSKMDIIKALDQKHHETKIDGAEDLDIVPHDHAQGKGEDNKHIIIIRRRYEDKADTYAEDIVRERPRYLRYEIVHWPHHFVELDKQVDAGECTKEIQSRLYDDLEKFLQKDSKVYQYWLRKVQPWRNFAAPDSPLHVAARYGLLTLLQRYYDRSAYDINEKNDNGDTPLHIACTGEGYFMGINTLCNLGADTNARNDNGSTPLLLLLQHRGWEDRVNILVDHGARPELADNDGTTPLHVAAELSSLEICRAILKFKEVDVNARDTIYNETPLHKAFIGSHPPPELVELLIVNGADVNAQDFDSQGPLYEACAAGDARSAAILLKHGALIDDDENVFGHTALQAATFQAESLDTIKVLIDAGANLTLTDKNHWNILHQAVSVRNLEILKFIVVSLRKQNLFEEQCLYQDAYDRWTPIHYAVKYEDIEMSKVLLENGDAVNALAVKDRRGETALHIAAGKSNPVLVRLLLDAGSDPGAEDENGMTPVDSAIEAWKSCPPDELPTRDMIATVLLLAQTAPAMASQPALLFTDIETEVKTPICSTFRQHRDSKDPHDWTPLALARQLKRHWKLEALLDHGEDFDEAIVGLKPTRLYEKHITPMAPGRVVHFKLSEDQFDVSTLVQDIFPNESIVEEKLPNITNIMRADHPVPACMPFYYFEAEIIAAPKSFSMYVGYLRHHMGQHNRGDKYVWFIEPATNKHGTDIEGHVMATQSGKQFYVDPLHSNGYRQGDVIGCAFDYDKETIFFTKNGNALPTPIHHVKGRLYPTIALMSYNLHVRLNFGTDPSKPFSCTYFEQASTANIPLSKLHTETTGPLLWVPEPTSATERNLAAWNQYKGQIREENSTTRPEEIDDEDIRAKGFLEVPEITMEDVEKMTKPPAEVVKEEKKRRSKSTAK